MTQSEMLKKKDIESGKGIVVPSFITDENGDQIGCYNNDGENGVYVFVTNDCGDNVFFMHTNSVENACYAILSYHQTLKIYSK